MTDRKARALFITGTDTDVGKTAVTGGLAAALRLRGLSAPVRCWKPVQTGHPSGSPQTDSVRLARIAGMPEGRNGAFATVTLPDPVAPWMAAERANTAIDWEALVAEGRRLLAEGTTILIEGAGGLAVPVTADRLIVHLAQALGVPLLIVARARLGTVNHTVLSVHYARSLGLEVAGVVLNGAKPGEERERAENVRMIETFAGIPVVGVLDWMPEPDAAAQEAEWERFRETWARHAAERLDWRRLGEYLFDDDKQEMIIDRCGGIAP